MPAQVPTSVARWSQMAAPGATICNTLNELWNGITSVSKPCRAWRPSLSDQAGSGGYPKTVTHVSIMSNILKLIICLQIHILSVDSTDVCGIKKESGPCFASIQRWHFDSESGMCRKFTYGGCRGNGNNFRSELECQSACRGWLEFFK